MLDEVLIFIMMEFAQAIPTAELIVVAFYFFSPISLLELVHYCGHILSFTPAKVIILSNDMSKGHKFKT